MKQELLTKVYNRLKEKEGFRDQPYRCPTGHWTIGYGHNLEGDKVNYHWINEEKKISVKDAEFLLSQDVAEAIGNLRRVFSKFNDFSEKRQIALIDMMFNMGMATFLEFVKMIYSIEIDDWQGAAWHALDSTYAKQVGPRAVEVAKMLKEG